MLTEKEMQELSNIASRLSVEGYNVDDIKSILATERTKINKAAQTDLINYFPITKDIGVRLSNINYGFNKLTLETNITLTRTSGVFDINSRPDMFENILRAAVFNCLKNIQAEYMAEVDELNPTPAPTTVLTASASNPISFTIGSNVLYTEVGSIDTASAWVVSDIKDASNNSIDNSGTAVTATGSAPLKLELADGNNSLTFTITSGSFDGSTIAGNNVSIAGGI